MDRAEILRKLEKAREEAVHHREALEVARCVCDRLIAQLLDITENTC